MVSAGGTIKNCRFLLAVNQQIAFAAMVCIFAESSQKLPIMMSATLTMECHRRIFAFQQQTAFSATINFITAFAQAKPTVMSTGSAIKPYGRTGFFYQNKTFCAEIVLFYRSRFSKANKGQKQKKQKKILHNYTPSKKNLITEKAREDCAHNPKPIDILQYYFGILRRNTQS